MIKQKVKEKFKDIPFPKGMSLKEALGKEGDDYIKDYKYDKYVTYDCLNGEERVIFDILN